MRIDEFAKDPGAELDYIVDWSDWLVADTIMVSTWSAPTGITIENSSSTTTTSTVWLSGGTPGKTYNVINTITTNGGRVDQRTLHITVTEK